jgi:hypothetical protein
VRKVHFRELAEPGLIGSKGRSAATGTLWIERSSGAVMGSELKVVQPRVTAIIAVDNAAHPTIKLWLPTSMKEIYILHESAPITTIDGTAKYSNFRQFKVDTDVTIK